MILEEVLTAASVIVNTFERVATVPKSISVLEIVAAGPVGPVSP